MSKFAIAVKKFSHFHVLFNSFHIGDHNPVVETPEISDLMVWIAPQVTIITSNTFLLQFLSNTVHSV